MNNLSWLIYLSDVVGTINKGAALLGLLCLVAIAGHAFWMLVISDNHKIGDEDRRKKYAKIRKGMFKFSFVFLPILLLISAAIPSKHTVMMIAASELAEETAKTEAVSNITSKAYAAVDKFIDDYLAREE